MMDCVFYLRASTNETKQKNSFNVQRAILNNFAESHGYNVIAEFSEYKSGRSCEREAFQAAVKCADETGAFLIVYRADRLSRSLDVFAAIKPILDRVRFVEVGNRELDPLLMSVLFGMAANESKVISVRVKAGMAAAKERNPNVQFGNPRIKETAIPAGLAVRKENAKVFNLRIKGLVEKLTDGKKISVRAIAELLNDFGVKTRRGTAWSGPNLRRLLVS
jgi:DNA invertase Pin-like site-specific DNA recombinase